MKAIYLLAFLLLLSLCVYAQQPANGDTIIPGKGDPDKQLEQIKDKKIKLHSDSIGNEPQKSPLIDTTVQNKYGDLLNDDTAYNKKYHVWIPIVEVVGANAFVWSMDRYLMNADFAKVGPDTWKYNLQKGWEWDTDHFGVNFIGHPYSGTLSFNAGRANGYNYLQSFSLAVGGSLMWEYFCENTRPSYNDIINTPVNGAFLGEIMYRISSNILDDRTRGLERFSRELLAGVINPMRGFNRILQGKSFRVTNKEIYQKEPLNVSLYAGVNQVNDGIDPIIKKGSNSAMVNIQFDYGNPFERRHRKPFDFFKLRAELDFGIGKNLGNITGYGILFGKNVSSGKHSILIGAFQYYDYWNNNTFELGTIGFGGGVFSKLSFSKSINLYTNVHIALIPFAGNSAHPDTSEVRGPLVRDYDFGSGLEGKFESTLSLSKYATISLIYYYYMIRTYVGPPGDNLIGILKPRVTVRLVKGLSLGFEHFVYYNDKYFQDFTAIHSVRTEQKIFLLLYLEDKQRRGHYN